MPTTLTIRTRQRGLTLVETIVALLLLASITIGITAIYAQRQNIARGGRLHARAVELAQQIAASIGANSDSDANFETTLGATCISQPSQPKDTPKKTAKNNVNSATNIVACWQNAVEQELADGSTNISLDRTTVPAQYIIVVSWSEPRSGTASYVLRVTPGSGQPAAASKPVDAAHAAS